METIEDARQHGEKRRFKRGTREYANEPLSTAANLKLGNVGGREAGDKTDRRAHSLCI